MDRILGAEFGIGKDKHLSSGNNLVVNFLNSVRVKSIAPFFLRNVRIVEFLISCVDLSILFKISLLSLRNGHSLSGISIFVPYLF